MFEVGLNPYGLTVTLGLQGNHPSPLGLDGFLDLAEGYGSRCIEIHGAWLGSMDTDQRLAVGERLRRKAIKPILSAGPLTESISYAIEAAEQLGAKTIRVGVTPVLCGARAELGAEWPKMLDTARGFLADAAELAAPKGLTLAIEDHQDLGSEELLALAAEAGDNVGITFDTGNPLAVGEDVMDFAHRVAPRVRHVHLKDYRAQMTAEGYRLVRCAIGDGYVPFDEIQASLSPFHETMTASVEPGALSVRHIRVFQPDWWSGYEMRSALDLGACLRRIWSNHLPEDVDWQTPFERSQSPQEVEAYERAMVARSVANLRAMGWMN